LPSIGFAPYNQENQPIERWRTSGAIAVSPKLPAQRPHCTFGSGKKFN